MKHLTSTAIMVFALALGVVVRADQPGVDDIPDIKEGLWESSTTMPGKADKPIHSTMCTSNVVARKMYEEAHSNPNRPCKSVHTDRQGSVITQQTECNFSGKVVHTTMVTTMTGNTGMRLESLKANNTVESVIEMKWVSACPVGMKLGDITGPDGKVMMNVLSP